jgi:hypothetical protein
VFYPPLNKLGAAARLSSHKDEQNSTRERVAQPQCLDSLFSIEK